MANLAAYMSANGFDLTPLARDLDISIATLLSCAKAKGSDAWNVPYKDYTSERDAASYPSSEELVDDKDANMDVDFEGNRIYCTSPPDFLDYDPFPCPLASQSPPAAT